MHAGALPDHCGNHAILFAYERGDFARIGASLHLVSDELDGGELIEVCRPAIYPHDNDEHLYCRSVHAGGLRLCALLGGLERGTPLTCRAQPDAGETFRHRDRTPSRSFDSGCAGSWGPTASRICRSGRDRDRVASVAANVPRRRPTQVASHP